MSKENLVPESVLKPFSIYKEVDLMEWARDKISRKVEADGERALEAALAEFGFVRERTCHKANPQEPEWFVCSECGCQCRGDKWRALPNYCANCGARVVQC